MIAIRAEPAPFGEDGSELTLIALSDFPPTLIPDGPAPAVDPRGSDLRQLVLAAKCRQGRTIGQAIVQISS